MHVVQVLVTVKKDKIAEFITATKPNFLGAINEAGNIRFDVLQSGDAENEFILYEVYESEAAAKRHKKTPHYLKWKETVESMMAVPRQGKPYTSIFIVDNAFAKVD